MLAGELVPAAEAPYSKSLIPLGVRVKLGIAGSPYFAARGQMTRQLEHLAAHRVALFQRRLQRPLHASPAAFPQRVLSPAGRGGGGGGGSGRINGRRGDHGARRHAMCGTWETRRNGRQHRGRLWLLVAGEGWARGTGPQAGCALSWGTLVRVL